MSGGPCTEEIGPRASICTCTLLGRSNALNYLALYMQSKISMSKIPFLVAEAYQMSHLG